LKIPLIPLIPEKLLYLPSHYLTTSPPDHVPSSVREKPRRKPARGVP
jgi:hypothetical protein